MVLDIFCAKRIVALSRTKDLIFFGIMPSRAEPGVNCFCKSCNISL